MYIYIFAAQVYTPNVDENAGPNTLVTTVVASDKDGDGVTFGFVGGTTTSGLFRIEENTGTISLSSIFITEGYLNNQKFSFYCI